MSDGSLIKRDKNSLISLLHGGGGLSIPQPFENDIFLLDTYIAGTAFVEGIEELEPYLKINDKLDFFREPDNLYDEQAIVIKNANGIKLGYVPRKDNIILARLMDAGKLLFGKITSKEIIGEWIKINIKIYLHD